MTKQPNHITPLEEAAYDALEQNRPFSSTETRQVRYWGRDKKIMKMVVEQIRLWSNVQNFPV